MLKVDHHASCQLQYLTSVGDIEFRDLYGAHYCAPYGAYLLIIYHHNKLDVVP